MTIMSASHNNRKLYQQSCTPCCNFGSFPVLTFENLERMSPALASTSFATESMNQAMRYGREQRMTISSGLWPTDGACPAHGSDLT